MDVLQLMLKWGHKGGLQPFRLLAARREEEEFHSARECIDPGLAR
ncbi:MAG: hypothetical protein QW291_09560 [Thermofilaceae archaeon]